MPSAFAAIAVMPPPGAHVGRALAAIASGSRWLPPAMWYRSSETPKIAKPLGLGW